MFKCWLEHVACEREGHILSLLDDSKETEMRNAAFERMLDSFPPHLMLMMMREPELLTTLTSFQKHQEALLRSLQDMNGETTDKPSQSETKTNETTEETNGDTHGRTRAEQ
jgi:hypothetical protein